MNARNLKTTLTTVALGIAAASSAATSSAQGLAGIAAANAAFDAQFNARLGAMQQQTNANIQAIWMRHLQVNGPRLRAQYQQLVASGQAVGTFEQFAYWDLMSASGTNNAGALAAQQAQYQGNQHAYATVQSGNASYNAGYWQNQAAQSAALARYSNQAMRGYAPYVDPRTGATTQLPYSLPQGQTYTANGTTYAQDGQGAYWRYEGNGYWSRMNAGR